MVNRLQWWLKDVLSRWYDAECYESSYADGDERLEIVVYCRRKFDDPASIDKRIEEERIREFLEQALEEFNDGIRVKDVKTQVVRPKELVRINIGDEKIQIPLPEINVYFSIDVTSKIKKDSGFYPLDVVESALYEATGITQWEPRCFISENYCRKIAAVPEEDIVLIKFNYEEAKCIKRLREELYPTLHNFPCSSCRKFMDKLLRYQKDPAELLNEVGSSLIEHGVENALRKLIEGYKVKEVKLLGKYENTLFEGENGGLKKYLAIKV
jgi:hypothetical protein